VDSGYGVEVMIGLEIAFHHFWTFSLSFDLYIDVEKLSVHIELKMGVMLPIS